MKVSFSKEKTNLNDLLDNKLIENSIMKFIKNNNKILRNPILEKNNIMLEKQEYIKTELNKNINKAKNNIKDLQNQILNKKNITSKLKQTLIKEFKSEN